jgi:Encapsulating protein for peroxidase
MNIGGRWGDRTPGLRIPKAADGQVIEVEPMDRKSSKYGEQTFEAVAKAYSLLQKNSHYGPYALVLHSEVYAAPLANLRRSGKHLHSRVLARLQPYHDLGANYFDEQNRARVTKRLIHRLERLGYPVRLMEAA